ncbi:DUF6975 family protein [Sphingobium boeckii]|uniref:Uncharacterized protein n=1 Tax=Sphingobium boeckii TaxID=1082345 RepID=A0A7W9EFF0_9SPHN|nr:hypothetical protein [Sphingobium boeckii]MBB5687243.1 hypothetical protein [Sphingobium boeckii]
MQVNTLQSAQSGGIGDMFDALVEAEGSGAHRHVGSAELLRGSHATRNLADAAHYLCVLHGRHPGVIDFAATKTAHPAARDWLIEAGDGFARERAYLTKLTVAAGPIPSTPGQAECESAVMGQRHALEMLAQSDRNGCALGAAIALVLDWSAIRHVLDHTAERLGLMIPQVKLPDDRETRTVAMAVAETSGVERAMAFGAQQILQQHRGLWDILEARRLARVDL